MTLGGVAVAQPSGFAPAGVTDHGALTGLADDDHLQYALLAGRALGQTLIGGTGAAESLTLRGSSAADRGSIEIEGTTNIDFDWFTDNGFYAFRWATTIPSSGGALAGMIQLANNVTVDNALFITSTVDDASTLSWTVAPGFAVSTLFFARPTYQSITNGVAPAQAFIYAAQAQYRLTGAGNVSVTNYRGFSFAPIIRVDNAGDELHIGASTGLVVNPLYNTRNATAVADYGTIRGVHMFNAQTVLFGQALGTEECDDWIGLDCEPLTGLTVNGIRAAVRSAIVAGASNRLIENTGGAQSEFGGGAGHWNDNTAVQFGGALGAADVSLFWRSAPGNLAIFFWNFSDEIRLSSPAGDRFLWTANARAEFNFDIDRFSFGAQAGANGNQVGNFVTPARTIGVAGEWADFLLTQAGSLTVDGNAMSRVSAWVINAVSYASSSGSVTDADTLTVGGFPTSSPGVTITNRQSLNMIGGRARLAGALQLDVLTPAALSSGDNDDYAGLLTGSANNGMRTRVRLTGDAAGSTITGFDTSFMQRGDTFKLTNIGTTTITLSHQDVGSSAGNRIEVPNEFNYLLRSGQTVTIWYDEDTGVVRLEDWQYTNGALGGTWSYDDATAQADPGAGNFRTDNNTVGSVTEVYLAEETETGVDASGIVQGLANGDRLYIFNQEDASEFLLFGITANNDQGTWAELQGSVVDSGNNFTDGKEFGIVVIKA